MKRVMYLIILIITISIAFFLQNKKPPVKMDSSWRSFARKQEIKGTIISDWNEQLLDDCISIGSVKLNDSTRNFIYSSRPGEISFENSLDGSYGIYISIIDDSKPFSLKIDDSIFHVNPSDFFFNNQLKGTHIRELFIGWSQLKTSSSFKLIFHESQSKIVSLRFLPLTSDEVSILTAEDEEKLFIFDNDVYTDFFQGENSSYEDFYENTINQYDDLNISNLNLCAGTTFFLFYDSKISGSPYSTFSKYKDIVRDGDRRAYTDFMHLYESKGAPVDIISGSNRSFGLFLSYRMNSVLPNDYRGFFNGSKYSEFKHKRQLFNYKPSFYYKSYRDYLKSIIIEGVNKYNPEGITLDFTRTPNFFGYELINNNAKSKIITEFLSQIRSSIPSNVKILIRFPFNYSKYNLDVPTWISRNLVDYISPASLKYEEFFPIDRFLLMVGGTNVKLIPSITSNTDGEDLDVETEKIYQNKGLFGIYNEYLYIEDYLLRTFYLYSKGCNGVLLFNTNAQIGENSSIPKILNVTSKKNSIDAWYYFAYQRTMRAKKIIS